jgi:hypothetical protein
MDKAIDAAAPPDIIKITSVTIRPTARRWLSFAR